jgi:hypothetical protein
MRRLTWAQYNALSSEDQRTFREEWRVLAREEGVPFFRALGYAIIERCENESVVR